MPPPEALLAPRPLTAARQTAAAPGPSPDWGGRAGGPPRGPACPPRLAFADSGAPPMAVSSLTRHPPRAPFTLGPHLSAPTPLALTSRLPLHRPLPLAAHVIARSLASPPTSYAPALLPTHILEPPVRQYAKPATARRPGPQCALWSSEWGRPSPLLCRRRPIPRRVDLPSSQRDSSRRPPQHLPCISPAPHLLRISPAASHEARTSPD